MRNISSKFSLKPDALAYIGGYDNEQVENFVNSGDVSHLGDNNILIAPQVKVLDS